MEEQLLLLKISPNLAELP